MRLEGQSKMGYYPTPLGQIELIKSWLSGQNCRWLDPCCGKGEALAEIARALPGSETYGIELSDTRATEANEVLGHVLNTAFEYAVLTRGTFSAVLLNLPYDGETETGGGTRLEERFLTETTPLLTLAGMLDVVLFPDVYRRARNVIHSSEPLLVSGVVEMDAARGEPLLRAEKVVKLG
ncbi:MAG: DUF6094 domain-containing protein [Anaerolineales bacterium]|nr:DUF6094 domain-containing protein [Anaerolineales bacterium]